MPGRCYLLNQSSERSLIYQKFLDDLKTEYGADAAGVSWTTLTLLYSHYLLHGEILPKGSVLNEKK